MRQAHARRAPQRTAVNTELETVIHLAGKGDLQAARDRLDPLLAGQSTRDDLHHLKGLLCAELGDVDHAIESIRAAIALNAQVPRYHHDLGMALFRARQWQAATDALAQAKRLDPVEFNTSDQMAQCQFELHCEEGYRHRQQWALNRALTHARTAIALRPQEPMGHTLSGIVDYELGEYGRSASAHDTARQLASHLADDSDALARQSRDRIWDGQWPRAPRESPDALAPQRGFDALYGNFLATALLPEVAQSQRHDLADVAVPVEASPEALLPRVLAAARNGDADVAQQLLTRWLGTQSQDEWQLLHDSNGRLCFVPAQGPAVDDFGKAGLLLELTLKCSHSVLRHAAGIALIEHLRAMSKPQHASALVHFLDDSLYYKYQRHQVSALSVNNRARCVVFGTCITRGLVYLLNMSEEFRRQVAIDAYVTNSANPVMTDFKVSEETIANCELLLHVPPQWADWGNDNFYPDLLARFDRAVPRITFPYPVFHPLWPYHCNDKRNRDPSLRNAQGQQAVYPYGDSYVLGLMRQNPTASAGRIAELYAQTDVPATLDLSGLMRHCFKHQRQKEQHTDVKIMDFVEERFTHQRLFLAVNHVSNLSLIHMANQVLDMLGMKPLPEATANCLRDLIEPQIPIHPSILRHFNISYLNPESRYCVDTHRNLTFLEYIEQYALFG